MTKTTISLAKIEKFLIHKYDDAYEIRSLSQLTEGLDSQAFRFVADNSIFVLRLNHDDFSFRKDALCQEIYGDNLPIPAIVDIGRFDSETKFCVSQYVAGQTLQDLSAIAVDDYLQATFDLLMEIREQDIQRPSEN